MKKNQKHLKVGIDLGSRYIRIIVATENEMSPHPRIITGAVIESSGIRQGRIADLPEARQALELLIKKTESELGEKIQNVNVAITGDFIKTKIVNTKNTVAKASNEITELDFENAKQEAVSQILPNSPFHILNTVLSEVKLDGKKIRGSALHQVGSIIEMKFILQLIPKKILEEYVQLFDSLELNILELVFSPVVTHLPLTKRSECVSGIGILNIGHDTTTFSYFENELPKIIKCWPIGGTHITNDIALILSTKIEEAEEIKKNFRNLNIKKVPQIISARIEDLADLLKREIKEVVPLGKIPGGIILIGGGAKIEDIENLFRKLLGMHITNGGKILSSNTGGVLKDPSWTVAYGLTYLEDKTLSNLQFLWKKLKRKLEIWLSKILP